MRKITIHFPFAPLSQNNIERTGKKTSHRYKTSEAKEYKSKILNRLDSLLVRDRSIVREWNPDVHGILLDYVYFIDHQKLLVKPVRKGSARRLSRNGGDTGNYEKYTTDCIFDHLGINDFFIVGINQKKVPSMGSSSFRATISIFPLENDEDYVKYLSLKDSSTDTVPTQTAPRLELDDIPF